MFRTFLLPAAVLIAGTLHSAPPSSDPLLRWFSVPGVEPAWSAPAPPPPGGAGSEGTALAWRPEFPIVPPLSIRLLDGETIELEGARGKVVLLDFWASWCSPCIRELPHLQELWQERRDRGLLAIAVNAEEPTDLALGTAKKLGLTFPLGAYDAALDGIFRVRTLPTVVLIDRDGRLRRRWDGYVPGLEREIAATTRRLLDGDPEGAPREVARVLSGAGTLEVAWIAELPAPAGGVAFFRDASGAARIAVTAGRDLVILDAEGGSVRRLRIPPEVDRLARAPSGPDGSARLLSFRVGGDRAVLIEPEQERLRAILAPAPVYDLVAEPGRVGEGTRLLWATAGGFYRTEEDGSAPFRGGESFEARRVVRASGGGEDLYLVLDREGSLRSFDVAGNEGPRYPASGGGPILAGAGGIGVADRAVLDTASGRMAGSLRDVLLLAVVPDRLFLLDAATGELLWSARWAGVMSADAGDLDGDGSDELLVVAGRTVAALRRIAPPAGPR